MKVEISMVEVKDNDAFDILSGKDPVKLKIKPDEKELFRVQEAKFNEVKSEEDLWREIESTFERLKLYYNMRMSINCSIYHIMYTMKVTNKGEEEIPQVNELKFLDLRGPERVALAGSGSGLKECKAINQSLATLQQVITGLSTKAKFVPYRNHMLTRLMQPSFSVGHVTMMLANFSPSERSLAETKKTIEVANSAQLIML